MTGPTVTPLHVWSGYSPLRGPQPLDRLVRRAAELGHRHLALTDTNNLYGAPRFHRLAGEAGLQPIIGAELRDARATTVAIVATHRGYENLCRILSRAHQPGPFDLLELDGLSERSDGLYLLVEDASFAAELLSAGVPRARVGLGLDPGAQRPAVVRRLADAAENLSVPLVALGKAMFGDRREYDLARLLGAIRCGATYESLSAAELPPPGASLRNAAQLARSLPGYPQAIRNNRRLVEECSAFRLLPRQPVFPTFDRLDGLTPRAYLRRLCREGIARRYGQTTPAIERRLARELAMIARRGFCEYFLVVWDIVQYARRRRAPVAGRGSGASSLVAYLLDITNVCPLRFELPFERFLNAGRSDFPDLDIDFCWRIRDDVIDYAFRRWGSARTAMICTHNTFQAKSAFRETAKAFGLSDEQISRLDAADAAGSGRLGRIAHLSRQIRGLLRNLSVHPGGLVIAPRGIDRYVPVQPAPKGVTITQYDKRGIELVGLVKLDLLGNRSLSTIRQTCDLVARHEGRPVNIESLPANDAATIATLQAAETVGCNQIESPAMRHLLRAMQPGTVRELMKALALIRPGAAAIGMKETFIRRHRGLEPVPSGFGAVDEVLRGTCGVMLYEDDVMLTAAAMLGTDLVEADRFRKAVQKCHTDETRRTLSREFLQRCRARGLDDDYAKDLWVQMAKFNAYSFCRAHAASYAQLAYATAYLKTHHPLAFWTACLNNNQSMYHPRVYVEQAKRAGVRFLLPDVLRSQSEFSIDAGAIRIGLNRLHGFGPAGIEALLDARRRRPFQGLTDLLARTGIGRDEARALVQCGALDATGRNRPALMMELNLFFSLRPHRAPGPRALLTAGPTIPENLPDYPPERKYAEERRILGVSVREHIMALHRRALASRVDTRSADLPRRTGQVVRIAGVLEARRTTRTRNGRDLTFLTLEDELGLFEVTVFPDACRAVGSLDRYGPYLVTGTVQEQYGSVTVTARRVTPARTRPLTTAGPLERLPL